MSKKSGPNIIPLSSIRSLPWSISDSDANFAVSVILHTDQVEYDISRSKVRTKEGCKYKTARGLAKNMFPKMAKADMDRVLDFLLGELIDRDRAKWSFEEGYDHTDPMLGTIKLEEAWYRDPEGTEGWEL